MGSRLLKPNIQMSTRDLQWRIVTNICTDIRWSLVGRPLCMIPNIVRSTDIRQMSTPPSFSAQKDLNDHSTLSRKAEGVPFYPTSILRTLPGSYSGPSMPRISTCKLIVNPLLSIPCALTHERRISSYERCGPLQFSSDHT